MQKYDTLFLELETLLTIFFLLFTLQKIYGSKQKKQNRNGYLFIPLWICLYKLLELILSDLFSFSAAGYAAYIISLLFTCASFCLIFTNNNLPNALALLSVLTCTVNSAKGIAETAIPLIPAIDQLANSIGRLRFDLFYLPLLILFCVFFILHPLKASLDLPKRYWITIIFIPVILLFITQLFIFGTTGTDAPVITLFFFFIVSISCISMYYLSFIISESYCTIHETSQINQRLELQLNHLRRSSSIIDQIRRDKHEMKNVYFYITSLCNENKFDELTEFANSKLLHRYDSTEEFQTGNQLIDYLLTQKVNEARDYSIHVLTNILIPQDLPIDSDDLCGLLLNLLDNAIDASKKEPQGDIHIFMSVVKSYLVIKIKNRSSIDVLALNPNLLTSKPDPQNHGIGMKVVRSVVKKYNGTFRTYTENGYFVIDAMLELSHFMP